MRILSLIFIFLLTANWSGAMIETMKLPELVQKSDFIFLAKVEQIQEMAKDENQVSTVKNVLSLEKALKGNWDKKEPLVIMTQQVKSFGEMGSIEDQVEFPPKGFRIIVFLKKASDGNLEVVNSLQGLWPLHDSQPIGMGQGITIKQLEDVIAKQKK
ncbi:hypothetical protein HYY75_12225 [bacterium]|nr:hypothetical protein [bacterium]